MRSTDDERIAMRARSMRRFNRRVAWWIVYGGLWLAVGRFVWREHPPSLTVFAILTLVAVIFGNLNRTSSE